MPGDRTATLQRVIATIQRRWGERALHILGQSSSSPATSAISTGFAALDQALGIGGLPRARMTELLGPPTSGKTTLALRMLAQAQQQGDRVGFVDLPTTFDPEYAVWCGVDLATLLLVRPPAITDAPDLILALLASGGLGALVVDDLMALLQVPNGMQLLDRTMRGLPRILARSPCALVMLTALPYRAEALRTIGYHGSALAHVAAIRLHIARASWCDDPPLALGWHARVTVLKHLHAPPGAEAQITIAFAEHGSIP